MKIKLLPETLVRKGYTYRVVYSTQSHKIYSQSLGSTLVAYEVGKRKYVKAVPEFIPSQEGFDKVEKFWSDEDCGNYFYTYKTLEEANNKLNQMVKDKHATI
jgi:hypothetical protein